MISDFRKRIRKMKTIRNLPSYVFTFVLLMSIVSVCTSAVASEKSYKITIAGGSAGGLWSIITEGVGETIRRSWSEARITTEPGKDGPNQVMVSRGEIQFAVVNEGTTFAAVQGNAPYKTKLDNIKVVAVLNPTAAFQCFIDEKTGIKSFQEIKDKKAKMRIGVNRKGTLMQVSSQKVLEAYGITFADIAKWGGKIQMIPGPQAIDLWDAGQLDGIVEFSQYPASRFLEHSKKHKLRMLPIAKEKISGLCKGLGVTPTVIAANTYPFQEEDYTTINTKLLLITSAEQPEEMV